MDLSLLDEITPGRGPGGRPNPHKFALLLAVADLFADDPKRENAIVLDSLLETQFEANFRNLAPDVQFAPSMIESPYYHLEKTLWNLRIRPGCESDYHNVIENLSGRFTRKRIREIFNHAAVSPAIEVLLRERESRRKVCNYLKEGYFRLLNERKVEQFSRLAPPAEGAGRCNLFVNYLNSLQRSGGSNENAMAESQACNTHFASIHVSHRLSSAIIHELTRGDGSHVILTGHAGDGKSTVALEVFKHLAGMDGDSPLSEPLAPSEDVEGVTILKDLSERDKGDDKALLNALQSNARRFLIVSNTGTLLDLITGHADFINSDSLSLEADVLEAISSKTGESTLSIGSMRFRVFNLALIDNLDLARSIFDRMLAPERWTLCTRMDCAKTCPIFLNVHLIQQHQKLILDRLFLAYRRMYEYGTRLTMRQFTEHLSYMITAGLNDNDIRTLQKKNPRPLKSEFLFFNRFFGDNGHTVDPAASQMKAIREIHSQGFGDRPLPGWEHRLWLRNCGTPVGLGIDTLDLDDEFEKLRSHGAHAEKLQGMTRNEAREQVRRMLYFLRGFSGNGVGYLTQYLNSPALISWMSWQQPEATLSFNDRTSLDQKIYHVLQEHFTGVRLPEGSTQNDRRLYVTLSQHRSEVRQSAQVVLAQIDWESSVQLALSEVASANGRKRRDLELSGKGCIAGISLPLHVPFLDYVMMRHFGELGEVLDASYRNRLDRFKAQVHGLASEEESRGMMLVRLRTDHTFRRQYFSVRQHALEVRDA